MRKNMDKIRKKIMDKLSGETEYFERLYTRIDGENRVNRNNRGENSRRYKHLLLFFSAIFLLNMVQVLFVKNENLVSKQGLVEAINRPANGLYQVTLMVEVQGKGNAFKEEVPLEINSLEVKQKVENQHNEVGPAGNEETVQASQLLNVIRQIKENDAALIVLPTELEQGAKLKWTISDNNNFISILILFILCIWIIYSSRYSRAKKAEKMARLSVLNELPDFINKIVLLLNAGLVFSSAFSRVVMKSKESGEVSYFLEQMYKIMDRVDETNSSLILELKNFSTRMQVRELIRTVNILSDNIYKGSLLVEKLEIESDLLWENRRKQAEEANRIGETKLSFPLAIHLIVLISLTIGPALIQT